MNNYVRGDKSNSARYTCRLFPSTDIMHSGGTDKYHEKYQENKIYVQTGRHYLTKFVCSQRQWEWEKVKVKFTLEQAMNAQRESRGIALLFL